MLILQLWPRGLSPADRISAGTLGLVHGLVGTMDQTQGALINLWIVGGYANTHCYFQMLVSKNVLGNLPAEAFGEFPGPVCGSSGK